MYTIGRLPSGRLLTLSDDDRRRHVYAIGKSGTGKSTLFYNFMRADLESGRGFALLDPHGDLAVAIAGSTPLSRTNDVIYLDPADPDYCAGFNVLQNVAPDLRPLVAAQTVSAFKNIWGDSWGPRLEYILTNALRLLLDGHGTTLLGLPLLLRDKTYRTMLLRTCNDLVVRAFWEEEFESYDDRFRKEAISPIQNKVGALLSPPAIRNIVGQTKSTFDVRGIMDGGKVLIVNLSKGRLGEAPAHFLGALFATAFAQAAERRADIPEHERRDFTLYADEFQHFATDSFATVLSEARKWHLALVLGHQFLGQVPVSLRQAVMGNVGTLIAFRVGSEDAPLIAAELGRNSPGELTDTPNFHAWAKLIEDGVPANAAHVETLPPERGQGCLPAVKARSRARHARPRQVAEARIARLYSKRRGGRKNESHAGSSRGQVRRVRHWQEGSLRRSPD
jgi:hypothetical protein